MLEGGFNAKLLICGEIINISVEAVVAGEAACPAAVWTSHLINNAFIKSGEHILSRTNHRRALSCKVP